MKKPVHVIVSSQEQDSQMWADQFKGVADVYRFDRNVDALERLTCAQSKIDLLVVTPNQSEAFNIGVDQLVSRLTSPIMARSQYLSDLQIIILTERSIYGAQSAPNLDAALKRVKYGEVTITEKEPVIDVVEPNFAPSGPRSYDMFASSVISRIWDAGDRAHTQKPQVAQSQPQPIENPVQQSAPKKVIENKPEIEEFESPLTEMYSRSEASIKSEVQLFEHQSKKQAIVGGGATAETMQIVEQSVQPQPMQNLTPAQSQPVQPQAQPVQPQQIPTHPARAQSVVQQPSNTGMNNDVLLYFSTNLRDANTKAKTAHVPKQAPQQNLPMQPPPAMAATSMATPQSTKPRDPFLDRIDSNPNVQYG